MYIIYTIYVHYIIILKNVVMYFNLIINSLFIMVDVYLAIGGYSPGYRGL